MTHPAPASQASSASAEYTIDELAAHTGVPSRTIRFYQARGVLPPPKRRGRIAVYDAVHAERLRTVGALQGKGLRLQAIRDVVSDADGDAEAVRKWFGVDPPTPDADELPELLTEQELKGMLGNPSQGALNRLVRRGALDRQGQGAQVRYAVVTPGLLVLARRLASAGVDLETAIRLQEILERRFARAARDVVGCAIGKLRKRLNDDARHDGASAVLAKLFGEGGLGEEAVRLIFSRELQRAVEAALVPDESSRQGGGGL